MHILAFIVLVGVASFLPRYLPFVVFRRYQPTSIVKELLGYAPVAVLAAIVVPSVLQPGSGAVTTPVLLTYLAGAAGVAVAGALTKRLLVSVAIGVLVFYLVRVFLGV